jgi:hypothetical protein
VVLKQQLTHETFGISASSVKLVIAKEREDE